MRRRGEKGQALVMVAVVLGIFLIGAVGLAVDTSQLYVHRQMAQAAADAAAQAAILSIFDATNVGTNLFADTTSYTHTCGTTDAITPCSYARKNGFGSIASDIVAIDIPAAGDVGLDPASLSPDDPVNLIRVTITRPVPTTIIRMLGAAATANVRAVAVAAICSTNDPIPILVLHPSRPDTTTAKDGSFFINGGAGGGVPIDIRGGPQRSIQVNSASTSGISVKGGSTVNLSLAGPAGTGGDFGAFGMTSYPGGINYGSTGKFQPIASPIRDPFGSGSPPFVAQPTSAGLATKTGPDMTISSAASVRYGCPAGIACDLYAPGIYTGIQIKNKFALFSPGIYYISSGGFVFDTGSGGAMAVGAPGTVPTGFTTNNGMLVLNSGNAAKDVISFTSNAGSFKDAGGNALGITLVGADPGLPYESILFFQDRTSVAHTHTLQGGGAVSLTGTFYLTNPWNAAHTDMDKYQTLSLGGNSGGTTTLIGQIIVDALEISGTAGVVMRLTTAPTPNVRRIALVQ